MAVWRIIIYFSQKFQKRAFSNLSPDDPGQLSEEKTDTVDGRNPAPVDLVNGSLSHYLQGFIHPRWCRISTINQICSRSNGVAFPSHQLSAQAARSREQLLRRRACASKMLVSMVQELFFVEETSSRGTLRIHWRRLYVYVYRSMNFWLIFIRFSCR